MAKANFEDNMENLEKIVTELEKGELNLDDSISKFEEGIKISKECNKILEEAEKKITILLEKDGNIEDDNRIVKSLETIKYALKHAKHVIIMSHLGRIKNEEDKKKNSLKIVCDRLSYLLGEKIYFCTYDENIKNAVQNNKIVMLENVRYFDLDGKKESNNDEELSKFYASLADVYINDAFGVSHRRAASTTGVSKYLESAVGFLVEEEINKLSILLNNPEKPFCIILGGAKVSDKIGIISNLIEKVDNIIIVGAMAFTFLKAGGINVGKSLIDEENIEYSKNLLDKYSDKIILPKTENFIKGKRARRGRKRLCKLSKCPDVTHNLV